MVVEVGTLQYFFFFFCRTMAEGIKINIYPCTVCQQTFSRASKLAHHMKFHWKEGNRLYGNSLSSKTYPCSLCSKLYYRNGNLLRHLITIHGIGIKDDSQNDDTKLVSFSKCLPESKPQMSVSDESTKLNLIDRHECNICNQKLTQRSSLKSHMRKHTGERPYKCNKCHVSFTFYQCLWNHRQKHSKQKRFQCEVCSMRFTYYQSLWSHYRKHLKSLPQTLCNSKKFVMPHECQKCKKKFRFKSSLQKHMKSKVCRQRAQNPDLISSTCEGEQHDGARQSLRTRGGTVHPCYICKVEFRNYMCLLLHMEKHKTTHNRTTAHQKPYRCNQCPKSFSYSSCLYRHIKAKHRSEGKSAKIEEHMYPSKDVEGTVKFEDNGFGVGALPSSCGPNDDLFSQVTPGRSQTEVKVMANLSCMVCEKVFVTLKKLRKHERNQHSSNRGHKCEKCGKAFQFRSWKERHQKSSHQRAGVHKKLHQHIEKLEIKHTLETVQNSEPMQAVLINDEKELVGDTRSYQKPSIDATEYEQVTKHRSGCRQVLATASRKREVKPCPSNTSERKQSNIKQVLYPVRPLIYSREREMQGEWKKVQQKSFSIKKRRNKGRKRQKVRPKSAQSTEQEVQRVTSESKNIQPKTFNPGRKSGRPLKYSLLCQYCGTTFVWQEDFKIHQQLTMCHLCGEEFYCVNMFCSHANACCTFNLGRNTHKEYREVGVATANENDLEDDMNNQCGVDNYSSRLIQWAKKENGNSIPTSPNLNIDTGEFVGGKEVNTYDTLREGNLALQTSEGGISYPVYDQPSSNCSLAWDRIGELADRVNSRSVDIQRVGENRPVGILPDTTLGYMDDTGNTREVLGSSKNLGVAGSICEGKDREHVDDGRNIRKGDNVHLINDIQIQEMKEYDQSAWNETFQTQNITTTSLVTTVPEGSIIKCVICSKEYSHVIDYTHHVRNHLRGSSTCDIIGKVVFADSS